MTTPAEGTAPAAAPTEPTNAAPAAPAAAPAAPAAPASEATPPANVRIDDAAPAAAEAPASTEGDDGVAYDLTGDPALDVALSFIGKLGIGSEHAAMVAAMQNDFSLLKATLATMGDKAKGWEQIVALVEDANTRAGERADQNAAKVQAAVVAVAGSIEQWNTIKAWAAQEATPDEKAALNAMFDAGPVQARAAAQLLLSAYTKAPGTVITPADPTRNLSGANPSQTSGALPPREYSAAVRDLRAKLGNRMDQSPEYAALRARFAAFQRG